MNFLARQECCSNHHFQSMLLCLQICNVMIQARTGAVVSNEEILGFAKLFNDELTLDNISRLSFQLFLYIIIIYQCFLF